MRLEAQKRTSGHNRAHRSAGRLPAVVYNKGVNEPVTVIAKEFDRVFRDQGTSSLIDLAVDGDVHQVLVREVQMDKRLRTPLHVDFYAITAGEAVEVHVPVNYIGTFAGEQEGGQLDVQRREVYISVLPSKIPNHIDVDISALEIGDSLHISDVRTGLPADAEILDDEGLTLVTVLAPRLEEEEPEAPVEGEEPEVIGEEDEDEEGAEGEGASEDTDED